VWRFYSDAVSLRWRRRQGGLYTLYGGAAISVPRSLSFQAVVCAVCPNSGSAGQRWAARGVHTSQEVLCHRSSVSQCSFMFGMSSLFLSRSWLSVRRSTGPHSSLKHRHSAWLLLMRGRSDDDPMMLRSPHNPSAECWGVQSNDHDGGRRVGNMQFDERVPYQVDHTLITWIAGSS